MRLIWTCCFSVGDMSRVSCELLWVFVDIVEGVDIGLRSLRSNWCVQVLCSNCVLLVFIVNIPAEDIAV